MRYFSLLFQRAVENIKNRPKSAMKFIDIGANLSDGVYQGRYHGKQVHEDDLASVINRAKENGVEKIIVTGGSLKDSQNALEVARTDASLFCTVGCHPTRTLEFEADGVQPDGYLTKLVDLATSNRDKVVAAGEMGLDFDRLNFSPKEAQLKYFEKQLEFVSETNLPVFFHCRAAHPDFCAIIRRHRESIPGGVVHSFTGTKDEAAAILDLDFYIGINGCSLKTQDNIDAMCSIPSDRLMLETDCPYCDIRPTHAGYTHVKTHFESKKKERFDPALCVKSRNEPCTIVQVLEVISGAREEDPQALADVIYNNTLKLFFKGVQA
ncbi:3'-5' ssDNA/RNA exonuclease tatd [Plakobranchus ocellatus]|uniref:Deoxyribonuclease TATDN1 n=1 Tax=Plakobranchus ocellatus TaxID=259542 RepID=A0AAV4ALS0_9GAST|nr:3'-5' ssDNA/RNA exonuclease tatd [Plakobranchus ocellatus]